MRNQFACRWLREIQDSRSAANRSILDDGLKGLDPSKIKLAWHSIPLKNGLSQFSIWTNGEWPHSVI
jgi:hypothetical protein